MGKEERGGGKKGREEKERKKSLSFQKAQK